MQGKSSFSNFLRTFFLFLLLVLCVNYILGDAFLSEGVKVLVFKVSSLFLFLLSIILGFNSWRNVRITPYLLFLFICLLFSNFINGCSINDIFNSIVWMPVFLYGYSFNKSEVVRRYLQFAFFFLIVSICFAYVARINISNIVQARTNIRAVAVLSYAIFPLMLSFPEGRFSFKEVIYLIALFVCTLISFKRTSVIMVVLGIILYVLVKLRADKKSRVFVLPVLLLFSVILVIILLRVNALTDDYLFSRFSVLEETGGNGRLGIWELALNNYGSSPIMYKMFGRGYDSVSLSTVGTSAHNDFIEYLVDFGFVGLIIFLAFMWNVFSLFFRYNKSSQEKALFVFVVIIWITIASFSHIIHYPSDSIPFMFFMGCAISKK